MRKVLILNKRYVKIKMAEHFLLIGETKMKKRIVILLLLALATVFSLSSCDDVIGGIIGGETPATVSFDTRGGNDIPDVTVNVGDLITEPDAPTREGYEFAGWYTDDSLSFKWRFDVDEVEGDMTLYAGWRKISTPPVHKCDSKCPECGKCLDEACTEAACAEKCQGHEVTPPTHRCESVCPECGKCLDEACTETACADKCAGHTETPPAHECESVCPECGKCLDEACTEAACADKCAGHTETPPTHECESKCPECGKCLDEACTEAACADKCAGHTATVVGTVVNVSDLQIGKTTAGAELVPGTGIYVTSALDIDANGKEIDGFVFTQRLKLGGTMKVSDGSVTAGVKIVTNGASTIVVYAMSSSSTAVRTLRLATLEGESLVNVAENSNVAGDAIGKYEFEVTSAGTYYLGSKSSGINIYYIELIGKETPAPEHTCESKCPECGKCLDDACTDTACADKCQGHTETPPTHRCESVCPECGKCLDEACTDTACADKCQGHEITAIGDIEITLAEAGAETIYFEWIPLEGVDGYKVYCDTIPVDNELIRFYGDHYRCDILGIRAELHFVKVVPVVDGVEVEDKATEFSATPTSHLREGFAFVGNGDANGAYNPDGTLKAGAVVIYVTNANKDTVSLSMKTDSKKTETKTGIQNILLGLKKGYYEHPICIRFIGNITDPAVLQSGDLAVDINNGAFTKGITLEGVGNDAVFNGFGLKLKGAKNVEVRNLGFMNCNSNEGDNVSLTQDNYHVWIHNCDFFYGDAGSDADQAKGDGALDTKVSQYITYSYNHFWDCGKVHLNGNKDTTVNYISYHHNWYDHCDSRMPRVRVSDSIHVYNNFFDGISKYCVGATMGSSIFVENNYFLNSNRPMSISMQGRDDGTFSSEDGGMIKAYGNTMINCIDLITYEENNTSFDYYEASSRDERLPSSVVALKGGSAYSNFDTDSDMYTYNVQTPEAAMESVKALSGRVQGGDFKWTFTDKDNTDYDVNTGLKSALVNYKTSLVSVGGIADTTTPPSTENPDGGNTENGGADSGNTGATPPAIEGAIVHNFHESGKESQYFTINGNLSSSKGTITYNGLTLTQCLKLESSTSITFTMAEAGTITLVFNPSANCKIDGQKYTSETNVIVLTLEAGTHVITKADSTNLYYIEISQ